VEKSAISDYYLFESLLLQLLGNQTANPIFTFLHDETFNEFRPK
jgi:hypothetical protein